MRHYYYYYETFDIISILQSGEWRYTGKRKYLKYHIPKYGTFPESYL